MQICMAFEVSEQDLNWTIEMSVIVQTLEKPLHYQHTNPLRVKCVLRIYLN